MNKNLGKTMLLVAVLTFFQKGLGFIRELVMAYCYGTSFAVDAFAMANSAAEIFMGFITAFGLVFLPLYSKIYAERDEGGAQHFMNQLLTVTLSLGLAVGMGVVLLADPIISIVAPGFWGETRTLAVLYLRMTVWGMLVTPFVEIFTGFLNYREAYLRAAAASLVVSPIQILVVIASRYWGETFLGMTSSLSNLMALMILYGLVRKFGFHIRPCLRPFAGLKPVWAMLIPAFFGQVVSYLNLMIDKIFGSYLDAGSIAALNYGFSIRQIFLQLFTTAIITILYPVLTKAAALEDRVQVRETTTQGLHLLMIIFVPLTVASILLAKPILVVFYSGGAFDAQSLQSTAGALICYQIGILFVAIRDFLIRICYSVQYVKPITLAYWLTIILNVTGNFLLVPQFQTNGLAFATSASVTLGALVMYILMCRYLPGLFCRRTVVVAGKIVLAALAMGGVVYFSYQWMLPVIGTQKLASLLYLIGIAAAGGGLYFLLLWLLRVDDVRILVNALRRQND